MSSEEDYDFHDIVRPLPASMPPKLKARHMQSSAQCPKCGSFDTNESSDTHGRYWRCRDCKLIVSENK